MQPSVAGAMRLLAQSVLRIGAFDADLNMIFGMVDDLRNEWAFSLDDNDRSGAWTAAFSKIVAGQRPWCSATDDTLAGAICGAILVTLDHDTRRAGRGGREEGGG
jgi:hypothetical protein